MSRAWRPDRSAQIDGRAVTAIVGVLVLVVITVCLAAVVALSVGPFPAGSAGPTAAFELSVDGSTIALEHVAGTPIDVEALSVTIAVNGTNLASQPPVPFVGANGFDGTPDGPFNARADSEWTAGERARLSVAETNAPTPATGDTVTVTLAVDGRQVADLETTAT